MKNIFESGLKLFSGIIYKTIDRYPTFIHIKSIFDDEWYNFIVPIVNSNQLDWEKVIKIIASEKKNGVSMSYYVPNKLLTDYQSYFSRNDNNIYTSSDVYICKKINEIYCPKGELVLVDDKSLQKNIDMAKICFPEWTNNEQYSRHMYDYQKNKGELIVRNYFLRVDGDDVGFCSCMESQELNLSYYHAIGVLPEFRRKGYFTAMIQHLMNETKKLNIDNVYALVEQDSGSYNGLIKLGYTVQDKYHLFSTN